MNYLILLFVLFLGVFQLKGESEAGAEEVCLKQFYVKYCDEKDAKNLEKILKCEEKNPPEVKTMEDSCYEKVRKEQGLSGKATMQEYQKIECDPILAEKFENCMNETLTEDKLNELDKAYPANKLDEIAKEIMYCDCDVYGIKHNKN